MTRRLLRAFCALAAVALAGPVFGETERPLPMSDVEAHDATELFSRLCVSTHGDRGQAIRILGDDDSAVEKLDGKLLRQLQGGKDGGVGWTIRMPLGEKLIFEFTPSGTCIVRAPRVDPASLEEGFTNLLDQIAGSGRFKIHREGDDTKVIDKLKYHFITYSVRLPDTGQTAEIGVATTDAKDVVIQGTLTYAVQAGKS